MSPAGDLSVSHPHVTLDREPILSVTFAIFTFTEEMGRESVGR